jgi:3-hydroxybutyryl-CoA dehydratase
MTAAVRVGDTIPELEFVVSAEPMKVFSILMDDPNPIHYDREFVRSLGRGEEPVNQGTITMGYLLNAVIAWAGGAERLLRFSCRFGSSVVAGDHVTAGGTVTALGSGPRGQTAELELWLRRSEDQMALTGSATVLMTDTRETDVLRTAY